MASLQAGKECKQTDMLQQSMLLASLWTLRWDHKGNKILSLHHTSVWSGHKPEYTGRTGLRHPLSWMKPFQNVLQPVWGSIAGLVPKKAVTVCSSKSKGNSGLYGCRSVVSFRIHVKGPLISFAFLSIPESLATSICEWAQAHTHIHQILDKFVFASKLFPHLLLLVITGHSLQWGILAAITSVSVVMRLVRM